MSNYSLEVTFNDDRKIDIPSPPYAQIYIQASTNDTGSEHRFISLKCHSSTELDSEIDRLHKELENIRLQGRAKFKIT